MNKLTFFKTPLPNTPQKVSGHLIVIEGPDNSGRSTQIGLLHDWLEGEGHAVIDTGLRRSSLVSKELDAAMDGNVLGKTTLSLFYATDFLDQVEKKVIPALQAGYLVIADRYVYTLMARAIVRGMDKNWIRGVYDVVPVPDIVFYLRVDPTTLLERRFQNTPHLDYWESGMDIGLSSDMYRSFYAYQNKMRQVFQKMARTHGFHVLDATRSVESLQATIRSQLEKLFAEKPRKEDTLLVHA